ncbi:MAG TPA: hypothetical protein VGO62_16905, partial [Myxococcota bacterium]
MFGVLIVSALAAASPPPSAGSHDDGRARTLVLDLVGDAVGPETRKSITGVVVVQLAKDARLDVVSGQDLRGLTNLEVDKQAAGCDDSCLAEIAGAMDAQLVVNGFVGKLGSLNVVNLSLFDAKKAKAVGRCSIEAQSIEDLPRKLEPAIRDMLRDVPAVAKRASIDDASGGADKAAPMVALALTGGGAALAIAGAVCAGGALV